MKGVDKHGGGKPLRSLLFTGALSYITRLPSEPTTEKQQWLIELIRRPGVKRASIALVNKTIRTAWALLRYQREYEAKPFAC